MSGWVKTRDVESLKERLNRSMSFGWSADQKSVAGCTNDWTELNVEFDSAALAEMEMGPRLGFNGSKCKGTLGSTIHARRGR